LTVDRSADNVSLIIIKRGERVVNGPGVNFSPA